MIQRMECTIRGAEGDIGADCETRHNHQEKDNGEERERKEKFEWKKVAPKNVTDTKDRNGKTYNCALNTKCGPFTKQVNVNWKP